MIEFFEEQLINQLHAAASAIAAVKDDEMKERLAKAMLGYAESMLPEKDEEEHVAVKKQSAKHETTHDVLAKQAEEDKHKRTTHHTLSEPAWGGADKHK